MIALLAVSSYAANAQTFYNETGCELRFKEVCLDPFTCAQQSASGWTSAPPLTPTAIPATGCTPAEIQAFIVENVSTCNGMNTVIVDATGTCATNPTPFVFDCPNCYTSTINITAYGTGDVVAN